MPKGAGLALTALKATPLAPFALLADAFGVLGNRPGSQKFLAGWQLAFARKSGRPLSPRQIKNIAIGTKRGTARLAALASERPDLIPENLVSLFTSSGGFNDPLPTGGFGGTDWGGIANAALGATFGYLGAKQQTKQLKQLARLQSLGLGFSAAPVTPQATGALGAGAGALGALGALGLGTYLPGIPGITDILPGGLEEGGTGLFGPDLFAPTAASARQRMIDAVHPTSGERVYWRPVGKPVLFSGDLALMKRTRKQLRRFCGPAGLLSAGTRRGVRRRR